MHLQETAISMIRMRARIASVGAAVLIASAAVAAAADAPDVIEMQNDAYPEHTKPIVEFPHKKHTEAFPEKYPDFFRDGCGTCHHDDEGRPLTDLAPGDDVDSCIQCHSKPGDVPSEVKKQLRREDLSREEKNIREREYHAEALHDRCRGCHREVKRKDRSTAAPTTCFKCHTTDESK